MSSLRVISPKSVRRLAAWMLVLSVASAPLRGVAADWTAQEFPNYFLPARFRGESPAAVPKEVLDESVRSIDTALASIFARLTVPVSTAKGQFTNVRYFDYVLSDLRQVDPRVKIFPSGGVVRSAIGYLYAEVAERLRARPDLDSAEVLKQIAGETEPVPSYRIRGIGSDFDLLLTSPGGRMSELEQRALQITNSAEVATGMTTDMGTAKRALFNVGDVKDFENQMRRSTQQGGSTIDFLAFDLESGRMVEPSNHPGTISTMVSGQYRYVAPVSRGVVEDAAKQTIRGLRPLMELPFLTLEDDRLLLSELQALEKDLKAKKPISDKALEQFDKMIRNSRYAGAHNRFYRSPRGSVESVAVGVASQLSHKSDHRLIPRFVDEFEIPAGGRSFPGGDPLKSLLISIPDFVKRYTDDGKLYHGTESIENGLAIMRGGLITSDESIGQGRSIYGPGGYSTPSTKVAELYAGRDGLVTQLDVRQDLPLRIIRYDDLERNSGLFARLSSEARARKKDLHRYLAEELGVDLIVRKIDPKLQLTPLPVKEHVIIQNASAVKIASGMDSIVRAYARKVSGSEPPFLKAIEDLKKYSGIYGYSLYLGVKDAPSPESLARDLVQRMKEVVQKPDTSRKLMSKTALEMTKLFKEPELVRGLDPKALEAMKEVEGFLRPRLPAILSETWDPDLLEVVRSRRIQSPEIIEALVKQWDRLSSHMLNPVLFALSEMDLKGEAIAKRLDSMMKTALYSFSQGFARDQHAIRMLQVSPGLIADLPPNDWAKGYLQSRVAVFSSEAMRFYEKMGGSQKGAYESWATDYRKRLHWAVDQVGFGSSRHTHGPVAWVDQLRALAPPSDPEAMKVLEEIVTELRSGKVRGKPEDLEFLAKEFEGVFAVWKKSFSALRSECATVATGHLEALTR